MQGSARKIGTKLTQPKSEWTHTGIPTDRQVKRNGKAVARIYQYDSGPQKGRWGWFGQWTGENNTGICDSMQEALEAVRAAYPNQSQPSTA